MSFCNLLFPQNFSTQAKLVPNPQPPSLHRLNLNILTFSRNFFFLIFMISFYIWGGSLSWTLPPMCSSYVLFCLLFGCPMANFGELLRVQPHSANVSDCIFKVSTWRFLWTLLQGGIPKPGQVSWVVWTKNLLIQSQVPNPLSSTSH